MKRALFIASASAAAVAASLPAAAAPSLDVVAAPVVVAYQSEYRLYCLDSSAWVRARSTEEALHIARRYGDEIGITVTESTAVREMEAQEFFSMSWEDGLPDELKPLATPCVCTPDILDKFGCCECDAACDSDLTLTAAEWVETSEFKSFPAVGEVHW